jgi:hypothetical protein
VTEEAALHKRSPTYELKFALIGFALGLSGIAGVSLAHSIHHHARHGSAHSGQYSASGWTSQAS